MDNAELIFKVGANVDGFKDAMGDLSDHTLGILEHINPAIAGVAGAIASIGAFAFEAGEKFEAAFNTIIQRTGATEEEMGALKQSFTDTFTSLPQSANDVAESLSLVTARLGLSGQALTDMTVTIGQLASIMGEDMKPVAQAVTQAFVNWNVATTDQAENLQTLKTLAQAFDLDFIALANTTTSVGTAARLAGEDFKETAARVAYLSSQGLDAETVYGALDRAQKKMIASGSDVTYTLNDLVQTIAHAGSRTDSFRMALELIGGKVSQQFAEKVLDGKLSVDKMNEALDKSSASIKDTFDGTQTLGKQFVELGHNMESIFGPAVAGWLEQLNNAIKNYKELIKDYVDEQKVRDAQNAVKLFGGTLSDYLEPNKKWAETIKQAFDEFGFGKPKVDAAGGSYNDMAAAQTALKAKTAEITREQRDLQSAFSESSSLLKSDYIPNVLGLDAAQGNLRQEETQSAEAIANLVTARDQLSYAMKTYGEGSKQAKDASDQLEDAETNARIVSDNLTAARKDYDASLKDNQANTHLLDEAQRAVTNAAHAEHIPALVDLGLAHGKVNQAISDQLAAQGVLNDFIRTRVLPDGVTEQQLKDNLTEATKRVVTASNDEKQAIQDRAAIAAVDKSATDAMMQADLALGNYIRESLIPGIGDLEAGIDNLSRTRDDAKASAERLRQAELDLQAAQASGDPEVVKQRTEDLKSARIDLASKTGLARDAERELTTEFGLSKTAADLLTGSLTGPEALNAALKTIGGKSLPDLKAALDVAGAAYETISSSSVPYEEKLQAQINLLKAQAEMWQGKTGSVPAAIQIGLADATRQENDYVLASSKRWGDLSNNIYNDVDGAFKSMDADIVSGNFANVAQDWQKAMTKMGTDVLDAFIGPAEKAIANFIATSLTDLITGTGSISQAWKTLGSTISGTLSMPGLAGRLPGVTTPPLTTDSTIPGLGGEFGAGMPAMPGIGAPAAAPSGGAGAASSGGGFGGFLGAFNAVTGAVSAVTGVLGLFGVGQGGQKDRLNLIADHTAMMEYALYGNGSFDIFHTSANTSHNLDLLLADFSAGWFREVQQNQMDALEGTVRNLTDIRWTLLPPITEALSKWTQVAPIVNIYLDGQLISANAAKQFGISLLQQGVPLA